MTEMIRHNEIENLLTQQLRNSVVEAKKWHRIFMLMRVSNPILAAKHKQTSAEYIRQARIFQHVRSEMR